MFTFRLFFRLFGWENRFSFFTAKWTEFFWEESEKIRPFYDVSTTLSFHSIRWLSFNGKVFDKYVSWATTARKELAKNWKTKNEIALPSKNIKNSLAHLNMVGENTERKCKLFAYESERDIVRTKQPINRSFHRRTSKGFNVFQFTFRRQQIVVVAAIRRRVSIFPFNFSLHFPSSNRLYRNDRMKIDWIFSFWKETRRRSQKSESIN